MPARSSLFMNVTIGIRRMRQTSKSLIVCGSTPLALSMSITAASAAASVRYVSSEKSLWPGVSRRFTWWPAYGNCRTLVVIEMPRCRSSSIQSLVVWRLAFRRVFTEPARWIAPP